MDKCQIHVFKWKKSDPHICTLYRCIYITSGKGETIGTKTNEWLPVVVGVGDNESKKKKKQNNDDNKNPSRRIPILNPGLFSSKAPEVLVMILWWMVYSRLIKGREIWECILFTHMSTSHIHYLGDSYSEPPLFLYYFLGAPSVLPRAATSAGPGNLLEIQILRLYSQTYWFKNSGWEWIQ